MKNDKDFSQVQTVMRTKTEVGCPRWRKIQYKYKYKKVQIQKIQLQIQKKMQNKKSHRDEEDLGGEECSKDGENLSQVEFLSQSSYCETICYSHQQVRSKLIIFSNWNNEKLRKNKEPPTEIWKKFPKVTK